MSSYNYTCLCVRIFSLYVCLCIRCMQCPQKAEGLIGSPGIEFTDSNEMLSVLRTETFSYIRTPRVLAETACLFPAAQD